MICPEAGEAGPAASNPAWRVRHDYAQTNLQFYEQIVACGWQEADLARVHEAHDAAVRLFAARFRQSGKPFLCHLIGTASVLARHGADAPLVIAGLLHAAYDQGEFGTDRSGMDPLHRARLRREIGDDAEALVARYSQMNWNAWTIECAAERSATLDDHGRAVVFLRAANEFEESLDSAMLFGAKGDQREKAARRLELAESMASIVGVTSLVDEIRRSVALARTGSVPDVLVRPRAASFNVHSVSLRERIRRAGVSALSTLARRVGPRSKGDGR